MLFCMNYAWPVLIAEGAVGCASSDFVVFFVHVLECLVFVYVVSFVSGAVPVSIVIAGAGFYAVVEYPHHHLRWPSSLLVSHGFMFIGCFLGFFFAYVSPVLLLGCVLWY